MSGARIKIAFSTEPPSHLHNRLTGACSDYAVVEISTLSFPSAFESISKLCESDVETEVNYSALIEGMNTMFPLTLPGQKYPRYIS